ncbi:MAG: hypothetical protein J2P36_07815, partial [Ktedonobacteraceae bacterium]|nr:hypothetical protein [Ktedonobacteraceae bacterium]
DQNMASKWLEERWEVLLPTLAPLGQAQEEQIKRICEEELSAWKARPSMKHAISLQKPLTETRNRIRETFPLTEANWWMNPKSGEKEHLCLKYLNFSPAEWLQITLPSAKELQERKAHPLPLAQPWALIHKVEQLLQSNAWSEIVVGMGLSTGRGIVEILHTGSFTSKTAYSILFAGPMTIYEVMCDPFEVPTLVRAEVVLEAVSRLRQFFGNHFLGMRRRDISQQCRVQVQEAAYKQAWNLVPLHPETRNVYKQLAHGVYPQLATWAYCPVSVDPLLYMATIQKHRKILETTSQEERLALALASSYFDYVVLDAQGGIDDRRGIRLREPGVEVLEVFQLGGGSMQQQSAAQGPWAENSQNGDRDENTGGSEEEGKCNGGEGVTQGVPADELSMPQNRGGMQQYARADEEEEEATCSEEVMAADAQAKGAEEMNKTVGVENEIASQRWQMSLEPMQHGAHQPESSTGRRKAMKPMARQWLQQRWKPLIDEMSRYTVDEGEDDHDEIWAICEAEMAAWRAYCEETKSMSFQEMLMETRIVLRTSLPAPWNEWWNPETEEWEHIGLKYLNGTEEEWEQMRLNWLDRRMLLSDPDTIVSRAKGMLYAGLMDAQEWPGLVVGIAVLTGQNLMRILKNGRFSRKSAFSLLFRDAVHYNPFFPGPFEVPTLARADLVVEAWERVRELVPCSMLDEQEILHRYDQVVSATAAKHFLDLVPLPDGETDAFTVLVQSVYPCLATHYYCPPAVESVRYLATICNDPFLLTEPSPAARFACAAVCKYMEYRLADERKGIWLDRPGVIVIQTGSRTKEEEMVADYAEVSAVFDEEDLRRLNEVRCQMGFGLATDSAPGGEKDEEDGDDRRAVEADGFLELLITLRNHGVAPALYAFIKAGLEYLSGDVAEFVYVCLQDDMCGGLKLQRPFRTMLSSELRTCDHSQATYELARRAIITVMRYNQSVSDAAQRWYLNEEVIFQIIQKSCSDIRWCLDDYQQKIDQHHQQFSLTADGKRKPDLVTETIHLPDDPLLFQDDGLGG